MRIVMRVHGVLRSRDGVKGEGRVASVWKSVSGSFAVKVAGMVFSFGTSVALARILTPDQFGVYTYVVAVLTLLAIPVQLGMPNFLVREIASAGNDNVHAANVWRWVNTVAAFGCVIVAATVLTSVTAFHSLMPEPIVATLVTGLLYLPARTFTDLRGAALRGRHQVVAGLLPDLVLRPSGFLALILVVWAIFASAGMHLTSSVALFIHGVASCIALIFAEWAWRRSWTGVGRYPSGFALKWKKDWFVAAVSLGAVSALGLLNERIDLLMLGFWVPPEAIGTYRVAAQVALLVGFGVQAMSLAIAPKFAAAWSSGDILGLQRLAIWSSRLGFFSAVPLAFVCFFSGRYLLGYVFGWSYASGYSVLCVLAAAQLLAASTGAVGFLLNMTSNERFVVIATFGSMILNVILNSALIPLAGISGAAIATGSALLLSNLSLLIIASRRIQIRSWII